MHDTEPTNHFDATVEPEHKFRSSSTSRPVPPPTRRKQQTENKKILI